MYRGGHAPRRRCVHPAALRCRPLYLSWPLLVVHGKLIDDCHALGLE